MANVRVFGLARDLKLSSQEVIDRLKKLGVEVKTASSSVDEDTADKLRRILKIDALTAKKKRVYGSDEDESERDRQERELAERIAAERAAREAAAEEARIAAEERKSGRRRKVEAPAEAPPTVLTHTPGAPRLAPKSTIVRVEIPDDEPEEALDEAEVPEEVEAAPPPDLPVAQAPPPPPPGPVRTTVTAARLAGPVRPIAPAAPPPAPVAAAAADTAVEPPPPPAAAPAPRPVIARPAPPRPLRPIAPPRPVGPHPTSPHPTSPHATAGTPLPRSPHVVAGRPGMLARPASPYARPAPPGPPRPVGRPAPRKKGTPIVVQREERPVYTGPPRQINLSEGVTVKELSEKMPDAKSRDIMKALISRGIMATVNQSLEPALAIEISKEFGYEAQI